MLKTRIKASQITNLTDARYFAAWGASYLGFDLDQGSDNFIEPAKVLAMKEWIEGPSIVGELALSTADEVISISQNLNLDFVQLNMLTDIAIYPKLGDIKIIQEIVIENADACDEIEFQINKYAPYVSIFLIDFAKNGINYHDLVIETKEYISELCKIHTIILNINWDKASLEDCLEQIQPYGLNLQGGEEEKVGFKSFDELDEIFGILEILE